MPRTPASNAPVPRAPQTAARTALVTGAGSAEGIGFACARALAAAGCRLALVSTTARIHERAAQLRAGGAQAVGHVTDLCDAAQVEALAASIGSIDILINNAGMGTLDAPAHQGNLVDTSEAQWLRALDLSLHTAFRVTRAFLPGMLSRSWGRIVNIASVTGPYVSNPGEAAYSAAKAGMVGMTHALALEVAAAGVTVNAVAPGWIRTAASTPAEQQAAQHTPAGRAGTPDEVAAAAAFLASEAASYINGAVLVVDGGNILQERKG